MGMTEEQQAILTRLERVVAEMEEATARLREQRDEIVLNAVEAKIPRKVIAEKAHLSEPMIYKIRQQELEKRETEKGG
ncbi:hypothetical protein [Nocardia sp. NPDC005745]|uniref:hypothetical protein n=1 Tax=Actinomycetes TaxID=1760 RepID=UPI0033F93C61